MSLSLAISEFLQFRGLLWQWTVRTLRARYKQSILGVLWAVLRPLGPTLIFSVVFTRIVPIDTGGVSYTFFGFSAMVPWSFSSGAISSGIPSIVGNLNLVQKIYFPREILPLSAICVSCVDFAISLALLIALAYASGTIAGLSILWIIPLLIVQLMLTTGVTLLGAGALVFVRDVRYVLPLALRLWMYATPIIYSAEQVPEKWRSLYFLNPMASIIDGYRQVLVMGNSPRLQPLGIAAGISLIVLFLGYWVFKRAEPFFADVI